MKARVIVTLDCNRNCPNCCNNGINFKQIKVISNIKELLDYEEIIITGGEPMLIPDKVLKFVAELRDRYNYEGYIYLYTALSNYQLLDYYNKILYYIEGIHYTVHYEATDQDIIELKRLSESNVLKDYKKFSSLRLVIDDRLYNKYDFSNIDFSNWSVIRKLKWQDDCPLPDKEELLIYNL